MAAILIATLVSIAPTVRSLITAVESATNLFSVNEAALAAGVRERKSCGPLKSRQCFSCAS